MTRTLGLVGIAFRLRRCRRLLRGGRLVEARRIVAALDRERA